MSIQVENLSKAFGAHTAVNEVSFDVPTNALFCIVGPSGCGKSTLLRLIAGLEVPDNGTIRLNGDEVAGQGISIPPEDRRVGVVFQSYALWPHMTVAQNVSFPYETQGIARSEAMHKAQDHLKTVALEGYAERRPEALSGGQRQRVALARCLAGNAQTILMDEPLANLDPHLRETMETELRAFHDNSGVTTLFITHDQREAMALADVMAVMDAGKILQIGPPQDIYASPANTTVARFIGRGTLIDADVRNTMAEFCGQKVAVTGEGEGQRTLLVRPEQISIGSAGWPCEVTALHYRGTGWEGVVRGKGLDAVTINLSQRAQIGERLYLRFHGGWILPG